MDRIAILNSNFDQAEIIGRITNSEIRDSAFAGPGMAKFEVDESNHLTGNTG